jgi:hypothetical protein
MFKIFKRKKQSENIEKLVMLGVSDNRKLILNTEELNGELKHILVQASDPETSFNIRLVDLEQEMNVYKKLSVKIELLEQVSIPVFGKYQLKITEVSTDTTPFKIILVIKR